MLSVQGLKEEKNIALTSSYVMTDDLKTNNILNHGKLKKN